MYAQAESVSLSSGLHMESLETAEKQVALICELLKGVRVPLTLSMMQVCSLSFVSALSNCPGSGILSLVLAHLHKVHC